MSDDGDEGDEGDAAPSQADFDKLRKQLLETQQKLKKSSMLAKWGKTQVEQLRQQVEAKEEEKRQLQEQLNTQRKRKVGPPPATLVTPQKRQKMLTPTRRKEEPQPPATMLNTPVAKAKPKTKQPENDEEEKRLRIQFENADDDEDCIITGDSEDDEQWFSCIREIITQTIITGISNNKTLQEAFSAIHEQMWEHMKPLNTMQIKKMQLVLDQLLNDIRSALESCTQLEELQNYLGIANAIGYSSANMQILMSQMRILRRAMVKYLIDNPHENINDEWCLDDTTSVKAIRDIWLAENRERTAAMALQPQAERQAEQDLSQTVWDKEALLKIDTKLIMEHMKSLFDSAPILKQDSPVHTVMQWILTVTRETFRINKSRATEIVDERVWLDLPRNMLLKLPPRYRNYFVDSSQLTPFQVLDTLIRRMGSGSIQEAIGQMKRRLAEIANESFSIPAHYARDIVLIERLKDYRSLKQWITPEVSLEFVKSTLKEVPTMDIERRRLLFNGDTSFDDMCVRISDCSLSSKRQNRADTSMLQVHAINTNQKNGDGLARARQTQRYQFNNNSRFRQGKGGKGWKRVERVEKAVRDTTTTSTTNRIRARGKNAKASHHTPPENVRSGQLFYAPNQRVRKHRSTHGKIAPTSIYLTSKNHSTRRNGMEKALTARGSINNLRRSKHKPKA